jgi:hypothetical protein
MSRSGLPLVCEMSEAQRLHSLAYATAIQSGAKGYELDEVTASLFTDLVEHANRSVIKDRSRPILRLVHYPERTGG